MISLIFSLIFASLLSLFIVAFLFSLAKQIRIRRELAALQRQFIEAQKSMQVMLDRMSRLAA